MGYKGYIEFIESFEGISPYELDHFSKLLFGFYARNIGSLKLPAAITSDDLREVITQTMQAAHLEIAQKKIDTAMQNHTMLKSRLLTDDLIPA